MLRGRGVMLTALLATMTSVAWAGGPRFVTGSQYSLAKAGLYMAWQTSQPEYFTDAGNLASTVSHTQADAMVAAAAAVWNVPASALVLAQGGELAEHVSSGNSYFDGNGVVFPADVQASNYAAKPIAVIYDEDGSVTDLLLGQGASAPSSCRQNSVTESVDGFGAAGTIQHAVLVLNGRCVGANPQEMLQMQYEVMRAFGRVLGLAWSQTNDNVFTSSPVPTAEQMAHWPVMHPIDVTCGVYSYQCMVNPFVLRDDDVSALVMLYPVTAANLTPGKVLSVLDSAWEIGYVEFPEGQLMDGVNVTATLQPGGGLKNTWQAASSVTGATYQQNGGNPVTGPESSAENVGLPFEPVAGYYDLRRIAVSGPATIWLTTEAINPLYRGMYALGPFERPPVMYSGATQTTYDTDTSYPIQTYNGRTLIMAGASTGCSTGGAGVESAPGMAGSSGWWSSALCTSVQPSTWWRATVRAGRSWTLEATSVDELGGQTEQKAQLVLGVWKSTDAVGKLPTVAAQGVPMNSMAAGMTQLGVSAAGSDTTYRFVVADQFGEGRPDFAFKARLLYADNVLPATVTTSGGQIAINGTGFANGNRVTVNGVVATVVSWSPTQIVAVAPTQIVAKAQPGVPVEVAVMDLTTGGSTEMTGALTYAGGSVQEAVTMQTATTYVAAGGAVSVPVSMRVTQNGVAAEGIAVTWKMAAAGITLSSASSTTGSGGVAGVVVGDSGAKAGTLNLQGCAWSMVCATWSLVSVDASQWILSVANGAGQSVSANGTLGPVTLRVSDAAGHALLGAPVVVSQAVTAWEGVCPAKGRCASAPVLATSQVNLVSDANGLVVVSPLEVPGVAEVVSLAVSSGTNGFVVLTLVKTP